MSVRNKLINEVRLMLGDGMIDIELDPDHYDLAVDLAISKIRQRSENAVEEDFYTLQITEDVGEYTLPDEIIEVQKIWNRSFGHGISAGIDMDPFEMAYANSYFFMNNHIGGIATYDFFAQYREALNRVAATDIGYVYNSSTHKLKLLRRPRADQVVLLHVFLERSEDELLQDTYLKSWAREYTKAQCKKMIGEARSKFSSLPGGGGAVTLNGIEMKQEADADLEKLDIELSTYIDGSSPIGFTIG